MSNPPYGGMPPAQAPWPPQGPPPGRQTSRLPLILTAALALIAIVVAVASWFRPAPEPEAQAAERQFSEQEVAGAQEAMCEAWETSLRSIKNVNAKSSPDDTLRYTLSVESQLAFESAANYIRSNLDNHPAIQSELAASLASLEQSYRQAVLAQMADASESELNKIKSEMDAAESAVKQECE